MLVEPEAGGGPPPGPPGGMDPIFESTEKSAFSSTFQGGEGVSAPTPAGLGSSDNLASVKKGFLTRRSSMCRWRTALEEAARMRASCAQSTRG